MVADVMMKLVDLSATVSKDGLVNNVQLKSVSVTAPPVKTTESVWTYSKIISAFAPRVLMENTVRLPLKGVLVHPV